MSENSVPCLLTEEDFDSLWEAAGQWGPEWASQDGRFENLTVGETDRDIRYDWASVYWFGTNTAARLLASLYFRGAGIPHQCLWDTAQHTNGAPVGYVILADRAPRNVE